MGLLLLYGRRTCSGAVGDRAAAIEPHQRANIPDPGNIPAGGTVLNRPLIQAHQAADVELARYIAFGTAAADLTVVPMVLADQPADVIVAGHIATGRAAADVAPRVLPDQPTGIVTAGHRGTYRTVADGAAAGVIPGQAANEIVAGHIAADRDAADRASGREQAVNPNQATDVTLAGHVNPIQSHVPDDTVVAAEQSDGDNRHQGDQYTGCAMI